MDDQVLGAPLETAVDSDIKPMLEGLGQDYVVKVFNPLSQAFRAKFARSIVGSPHMNAIEMRHQQKMQELGIPVTKDGGSGLQHVVDYQVIPAGATINLPGDIAQVVVRQLVNTILQLRNAGTNSNQLADPYARQQTEKEVVINYKSIMETLNDENPADVIRDRIAELNNPDGANIEEQIDEQAFPDITPAPGTGATFDPRPQGDDQVSEDPAATTTGSEVGSPDTQKRSNPVKTA